jgi:hypothetical protein
MIAALVVTSASVPSAWAGAPMGLPTAYLGQDHWGAGVEYGHEQMDLEAEGTVVEHFATTDFAWTQRFQMEDVAGNMILGTLGYGLADNWDIFLRAGAANSSGTIIIPAADTGALWQQDEFDASFGFAGGGGTRATFWKSNAWSIGGLAQFLWFNPGDSSFSVPDPLIPDESWMGDVSLSYWQAQVSVAVAYEGDALRLWAGPFLQILRGDLDFNGQALIGGNVRTLSWTSDLEESSPLGGHFGASLKVTDEWNLWAEGQVMSDFWLVSVGLVFVLDRSLDL